MVDVEENVDFGHDVIYLLKTQDLALLQDFQRIVLSGPFLFG